MSLIYREIYGRGQPVVMIHGWGMHTGIWREFARQLAECRQVICLDLPGHGRSPAIPDFSLEMLGSALLEAIPVEKFSVIGWSLGATIAMHMAGRYSDRVQALLLLAGNPKFVGDDGWPGVKEKLLDGFIQQLAAEPGQTLIRFLALQVNGLPNSRELLQQLKSAMLEVQPPQYKTLEQGLEILKHADLRPILADMKCPVTFVQGDKDGLIPVDSGFASQKLNPLFNLQLIEQAGHLPFLSHQMALLDMVKAAV